MEFLSQAPLAYSLIIMNIGISLFAFNNTQFMEQYIFHMGPFQKGREYYRALSSAFLHADPMHLMFNMLTLYFFGPQMEQILGTSNFAIVYFGSQAGAKALTIYRHKTDLAYRSLGASGAVSGVVLAFCTIAPFAQLYLFGLLPLPAIIFAAGFLGYSMLVMGRADSRIAHDAHLGGAITGAILTLALAPDLVGKFV